MWKVKLVSGDKGDEGSRVLFEENVANLMNSGWEIKEFTTDNLGFWALMVKKDKLSV